MKNPLIILAWMIILSCQPIPEGFNPEDYKNQNIEGIIQVSAKLSSEIKDKRFLTVSVRDLSEPAPIAVLNVKDPSFPYRFKIDGKNKIDHDRPLKGKVIILARLSSEQGTTAKTGDLMGSAEAIAGQRNVLIIISTRLD